MKEMPGYCCTLQRCKVPKKDWPTMPPCDGCDKAMDLNLAAMEDQAIEGQQRARRMSEYLREVLTEENLWKPICKALVDRALNGDLKAIEFIMTALGETPGEPDLQDLRVLLGPGVEDMAK